MRSIITLLFILSFFSLFSQSIFIESVSNDELKKHEPKLDVTRDLYLDIPSFVRAVNRYANKKHNAIGRPAFEKDVNGDNIIYVIAPHLWKDVNENQLHAKDNRLILGHNGEDPKAWHRATNRLASEGGFAGLPTFEIGANRVHGVHYVNPFKIEDVSEEALNSVDPSFKVGIENSYAIWARAANRYAQKNGFIIGIPNFEIGENRVRGVYFFEKSCKEYLMDEIFNGGTKHLIVNKGKRAIKVSWTTTTNPNLPRSKVLKPGGKMRKPANLYTFNCSF